MTERKIILIVILSFILILGGFILSLGFEQTWDVFGVPDKQPGLRDIRTLTHGSKTFHSGGDPLQDNPNDPWQRPLNYPRVWQLLYYLGLNESHTVPFGIGIIFSYLLGVLVAFKNITRTQGIWILLALISPISLTGIESANNDLLIFLVVVLYGYYFKSRAQIALVLIILAFSLKLFPLFAAGLYLFFPAPSNRKNLIIFTAYVMAYIGFSFSDLKLIYYNTPKGINLSYGISIMPRKIIKMGYFESFNLITLSYCLFFICTLLSIWWLRTKKHLTHLVFTSDLYYRLFLIGAAIYVGTFLLGANWNYRLVFLILTLPQLVEWLQHPGTFIRLLSATCLAFMLLVQWHPVWKKLGLMLYINKSTLFFIEEISSWILAIGLISFLGTKLMEGKKEFGRHLMDT